MEGVKKRPPIRQFSFQYDSSKVPERRKSLKKQFSEDFSANVNDNVKEIESPPNSIRVSLSAKGTNKNFNKNPKEIQSNSIVEVRKPKLILPLNPEFTNINNVKNVFQKHIRNEKKIRSFSPSSSIRTENSPTIIVPLITQKESKTESIPVSNQNSHVIIKDLNQKRSRSASSISTNKKENQFRPPLIRQSSVPVKTEIKTKFPVTKRRVKTAKPKLSDDLVNKRNLLKRCVSVSEVETMVSLVSENEESENEDKDEVREEKIEDVTPLKTSLIKENNERNFSLRKTIKSVSFQQSTIHAIRSFSASFPERRKSMATALFLNASSVARVYQIHEKRSPINAIDDDGENVPKRRLIRTKSAPLERRSTSKEDESPRKENTPQNQDEISPSTTKSLSEGFNNNKEQECWDMYRKMNEKGVTISFDTILRGMLTPTEYRLRSKAPRTPSSTGEDNCEITEN